MGSSNLTRRELGWLLAQEAQGAADVLRAEVNEMRASLPPVPGPGKDPTAKPLGEQSLLALDNAIALLTNLQAPDQAQSSRARVDLASLLLEQMPSAQLRLEPGLGTEVFADRQQLGKLLQLFFSQSGSEVASTGKGTHVEIQREDGWVRLTTDIGPDSPMADSVERRWMHKMASQLGGRVELRGRNLNLLFPADNASEELTELKRELAQAQQLGEVYAQELATCMSNDLDENPREPAAHGWRVLQAFARGLLGSSSAQHATETLQTIAKLRDSADPQSREKKVHVAHTLAQQVGAINDDQAHVRIVETSDTQCRCSQAELEFIIQQLLFHARRASPSEDTVEVSVLQVDEDVPVLRLICNGPELASQSSEANLYNELELQQVPMSETTTLISVHCLLQSLGGGLQVSSARGLREWRATLPT